MENSHPPPDDGGSHDYTRIQGGHERFASPNVQRSRSAISPGQDTVSTASPGTPSRPYTDPNAEQTKNIRRAIVVLPFFVLLVALFVQNWGQYSATRSYVRWMDSLSVPQASIKSSETFEVVFDNVVTSVGESPEASSLGMSALGCFICLLVWAWVACVVINQDVRLSAHTMLAISGMAALKGFLCWATAVPDASGWSSCQQRLGEDGLGNYRQDENFFQAVLDVFCLEMRVLCRDLFFQSGNAARDLYCTNGFISAPTYLSTIFSLAICDFACVATRSLPQSKRRALLGILWTILVVIVLSSLICPVSSRYHYTADVVVSILLAILVYSSPAVAIFADRIAQAGSGHLGPFMSLCYSAHMPTGSIALVQELVGDLCRDWDGQMLMQSEDEDARTARDVGQVFALPCLPWLWEPTYYLRSQPGRLGRAQKDNTQDTLPYLQDQIEEFKRMEDSHTKLRKEKEAELEAARERRRTRAAEAFKVKDWNHKSELASEKNKFEKEENAALDDMRRCLAAEEEMYKNLSERIAEKQQICATKGAEREKMEAALAQTQAESLEVVKSCQQRQAEIDKLQRKIEAALEARAREAARQAVRDVLEVAQANVNIERGFEGSQG